MCQGGGDLHTHKEVVIYGQTSWHLGLLSEPKIFSPKIVFPKMTQNGLKWILNATLYNVTFWPARPPLVTFVKFFFEGFPNEQRQNFASLMLITVLWKMAIWSMHPGWGWLGCKRNYLDFNYKLTIIRFPCITWTFRDSILIEIAWSPRKVLQKFLPTCPYQGRVSSLPLTSQGMDAPQHLGAIQEDNGLGL